MTDTSILKNLKILPMTFDDLEDVLKIEKLSFPSPWPKSQFVREIGNPFSNKFTAKIVQDGKEVVAAYIIFWVLADEAHILNIATHPEFRWRGIAKNLLVFTLNYLGEVRAREVFLEVRKSNTPAQRLYKDLGFKEIGVRKGYYGNNKEDAIVMALTLADVSLIDFEEEG